jgi:hypothetical protein
LLSFVIALTSAASWPACLHPHAGRHAEPPGPFAPPVLAVAQGVNRFVARAYGSAAVVIVLPGPASSCRQAVASFITWGVLGGGVAQHL